MAPPDIADAGSSPAAFPPSGAPFATADLFDMAPEAVTMIDAPLRHFGGRRSFSGACSTLRANDNPQAIADAVAEPGKGRVLVIDGSAVRDCASFGEKMGRKAHAQGWSGVIVFGAIRDTDLLAELPIGVMALRTTAKRPFGTGATGERDIELDAGGVRFVPGAMVYADADAVLLVGDAR